MTTIWERYFLKEICKTTFFFIACFYGLYVLIDYASHSASFHHHQIQFQWGEVSLYYVCELAERLEILLPFALLLATIRTLCNLNVHNELIALMSSGISLKRLLRPFLIVGIAATAFMYLNTEFFLPTALTELKHIDTARSNKKTKNRPKAAAKHLTLDDGSTMIFQRYETADNYFFDAFWVRSIDDVYRIKHLYPNTQNQDKAPFGEFVDHLQRNQEGQLIVAESVEHKTFPEMRFNKKTLFETITHPEEQSISVLWSKLPSGNIQSDKDARLIATFYKKLANPWFCLFVILGPAPFCLFITRRLPIFFIYAGCIFALLAGFLIIDAFVLLGGRQALPAFWAVWTPFALIAGVCVYRYARLRVN
ncbi:MAG: LptF/LptG family permease [Parachlamydiaceae bacterium]|nr:LptF/LptG family permease [Parachlamydiaceae bacterium]